MTPTAEEAMTKMAPQEVAVATTTTEATAVVGPDGSDGGGLDVVRTYARGAPLGGADGDPGAPHHQR
jgi:hypothetical protein